MTIKLKDIKLFEGVDLGYVKMIIDNSRRIKVKKDEVILYEGGESNGKAYIIQDGVVRVEIGGKEVSKLTNGEIFGEMALITDDKRIATIIAETDLILLQIDKKLLHTIIKKFKNGKDIQKVFMDRILENVRK
ncbi:cyclic nucleotide-binding domain-containing protein [Candidatus Gracilibacteria bacterium]|nr:cyclic nucleotide-binding domain-containing protein [Candidatus Gracilibacteria bacterium]